MTFILLKVAFGWAFFHVSNSSMIMCIIPLLSILLFGSYENCPSLYALDCLSGDGVRMTLEQGTKAISTKCL